MRIVEPSSEMRDAALPRADYGEWRGRSGIPKSGPPVFDLAPLF
jgi:hypothetical protein